MKKTLALVLAMAVISVFAVIPAFAADTMVFKLGTAEIEAGSGSAEVTLGFSIDIPAEAGSSANGGIQFGLILPEGISYKSVALAADNTFAWTDNSTGSSLIWFADDSGVGADLVANPEYSKIDVTLVVDDISKAAEYDIKFDTSQSASLDFNDFVDQPSEHQNGKIVVKAAAPSVKTVAKSDSKIVEQATTIDGKITDTQIGAAVGIQFTAPDGVALQNKMIWAVQTSDGRKYSKPVDVDFSDISGTVTVAATFHNGIHENGFGVAEVAPLSITGVDAIFTDGTNDYFTNAADKDAKAE